MTALGILWFVLVVVLMIGYFVLDGLDLGVGVLYPFLGKDEASKKVMIRAVGPIWDGNEVWLLTAGGALFAAFPAAYATSFSGFYLAIMLVLFGLILRAVAIEFRVHEERFRGLWDGAFFIGSLLPALLFGVAVGNIIGGLPLDANGDYTGTFLALLNPFALLCGVAGLMHMLTQGASWIALKAPQGSALRAQAAHLRRIFALVALIVFAVTTLVFLYVVKPGLSYAPASIALGGVFGLVYALSVIGIAFGCKAEQPKRDVLASVLAGVGCVGMVGVLACTLFPTLIPATDPALSITIANAASGDTTLFAMTVIACIGVPLVLIYHVIIYYVFRGRVSIGE